MAARLSMLRRFGQNYLGFHLNRRLIYKAQQWRSLQTCQPILGVTKLTMPALSPTMEEGTIIKWHKQEGDVINPGDSICEIQTDKAVLTLDLEEEGVLAKILKPDDSKNIRVGTLIALLVDEGDDWQNVEVPQDAPSPAAPAAGAAQTAAPPAVTPPPALGVMGYGPAVRSILDIYKINANDVQGTGPHARLLKGDLLQYIKDKGLKPAPIVQVAPPLGIPTPATPPSMSVPSATAKKAGPPPPAFESDGFTDLAVTSMRKTIAKRLTESKTTIPHAYATADCRIDNIISLRKDLLADGIKVSVNDFIVKAAAVALQRVPTVNAMVSGESVQMLGDIDISVAVATPNGLITPIIKNAIGLGVQDISSTIKELAGRAREGKLKLNEFQGGSFTISNLGMFGISHFSAVINPPQACIMAVGTSRLEPGPEESARPETRLTVTLASDARVVDDQLACQFLQEFKEIMENPMLMLGSSGPKDLHIEDGEEKIAIDKAKLFAT